MNRRDALKTTAAAGAVLSFAALAADPVKADAAKAATKPSGIAAHKDVYEAALACVRAGQECLDHCVRSLSTGDKMMAECAGTVRAMLPLCAAVAELSMLDSAHLKALAAVCAKACRDCEAACKKHSGHHAECKACMESCAKCAAACEKA
ncbi:MAG: Csp1 family four helix bundle copper storage protein [Archangium sp.]|nr:Csp1 family four helix bundle copper storage protein [Archangium sp.]